MSRWDPMDFGAEWSYSNIFGDPAFLQNGDVTVDTGEDLLPVRYNHIKKILPALNCSSGYIRLPSMASKITRTIGSRQITPTTALNALFDTFSDIQSSMGSSQEFQSRTYHRLQTSLHLDIDINISTAHCRRHFILLAGLSRTTASEPLALVLANFFRNNHHTLVQDRSQHLIRWGLALMDLRPRLPAHLLWSCFRALAYRLADIAYEYSTNTYFDRRVPELVVLLQRAAFREDRLGYLDVFDARGRGILKPFVPRRVARSMPPPMRALAPAQAQWDLVPVQRGQLQLAAGPFVGYRGAGRVGKQLQNVSARLDGIENGVEMMLDMQFADRGM